MQHDIPRVYFLNSCGGYGSEYRLGASLHSSATSHKVSPQWNAFFSCLPGIQNQPIPHCQHFPFIHCTHRRLKGGLFMHPSRFLNPPAKMEKEKGLLTPQSTHTVPKPPQKSKSAPSPRTPSAAAGMLSPPHFPPNQSHIPLLCRRILRSSQLQDA